VNLKLERSGPWIGVTGLFVMLWLAISSVFLYAPWWGLLIHLVVLALFIPLLRSWATARPARCIWIPVYAFLAWCAINALGVLVFNWHLK
jgi:hypothetical protein